MPNIPEMPKMPGGRTRQQRGAQIEAEIEAKAAAATQKAGAQLHQVQEGETLESIARRYGQSPDAIWQHPLNKQLKNRLGTAEGLGRGDGIYIPGAEQEQEQSGGPVGQGEYVVKEGDCISSIAKDTGHFWETIWNDSGNSELKEVRKDPNILLPGDRVTIPELRKKEEPGETEMRHRFVRRGEPSIFRVRLLLDDEQPRANEAYVLEIDEERFTGFTDADGKLEVVIPGNARRGRLLVGPEDNQQEYDFDLGHVDPITEVSGVQRRLNNLEYDCGEVDGVMGPKTRSGILRFQEHCQLEATGELDGTTREELRRRHQS